jgi:MFS transporter, SP family, general alpha glucoside:H+ symporter
MAPEDEKIEKKAIDHVESVEVTKEAKIASQTEKETTFWQALKSNKKSAMWSAVISLTIIMEGYDIGMESWTVVRGTSADASCLGLIYQFFAYPSFAEQFGAWDPATKTYQVSGPWQAGLSNGANCGVIIGGEEAYELFEIEFLTGV